MLYSSSSAHNAPFLSVILPAFNEGDTIETSLVTLSAFLNALGHSYEIVVSDDGSAD